MSEGGGTRQGDCSSNGVRCRHGPQLTTHPPAPPPAAGRGWLLRADSPAALLAPAAPAGTARPQCLPAGCTKARQGRTPAQRTGVPAKRRFAGFGSGGASIRSYQRSQQVCLWCALASRHPPPQPEQTAAPRGQRTPRLPRRGAAARLPHMRRPAGTPHAPPAPPPVLVACRGGTRWLGKAVISASAHPPPALSSHLPTPAAAALLTHGAPAATISAIRRGASSVSACRPPAAAQRSSWAAAATREQSAVQGHTSCR